MASFSADPRIARPAAVKDTSGAFLLLVLILLVGMWLLGRLAGRKGRSIEEGRQTTLVVIYVGTYLTFALPSAVSVLVLAVIAVLGAREWSRAVGHRSYRGVWLLGGDLVILIGVLSFVLLRLKLQGGALCLFVFFLTNLVDTSAYFCGRAWGNRKLAAFISPGKTIEGSVGAMICAIPLSILLSRSLGLPFRVSDALLYAAVIGVAAQLGDLAASAAKRGLGTKDFGTSLPGHGGLLDRLDSSLLSAPAFLVTHSLAS